MLQIEDFGEIKYSWERAWERKLLFITVSAYSELSYIRAYTHIHPFWQLFAKDLLCSKHGEYLGEHVQSCVFLMELDERSQGHKKGNYRNYGNTKDGYKTQTVGSEEGRCPGTKCHLNWDLRINISAKGQRKPSSPARSLCKDLSPFAWDWSGKDLPAPSLFYLWRC